MLTCCQCVVVLSSLDNQPLTPGLPKQGLLLLDNSGCLVRLDLVQHLCGLLVALIAHLSGAQEPI